MCPRAAERCGIEAIVLVPPVLAIVRATVARTDHRMSRIGLLSTASLSALVASKAQALKAMVALYDS